MTAPPLSKTAARRSSKNPRKAPGPQTPILDQSAGGDLFDLLESMGESYFESDLKGRLTVCNDHFCRLHGRSREVLNQIDYRQLIWAGDARKVIEIFKEVYRTGRPSGIFEYRIIRADGTSAAAEAMAVLRRNPEGLPVGFRGIFRDITERKKMETALRQSEEKHRSILANIEEGYYEVDLRGNFSFVNEAVCRSLGRTREEVQGMNYKNYMPPSSATETFRVFHEVFQTGNPAKIFKAELIQKDGSLRVHEMSIAPLRQTSGEIIGFSGISRDRTEQLQMEKQLQESEESYRSIMDIIPDTLTINRVEDGRYVQVNRTFCEDTGYKPEEVIGLKPLDLGLFADPADQRKLARALLKGPVDKMELQFKIGRQRLIDCLVSSRSVRFKGQACHLFVSTNITTLKQAQQALRESEESYRRIIELAPDAITISRLQDGKYFEVNATFCQQTGYRREEVIGRTLVELRIFDNPEDRLRVAAELRDKGRAEGMEILFRAKGGAPLLNLVSMRIIQFKGQECVLTVATLINELKAAQGALEERERGYRAILETAPYSITLTRLADGCHVQVNEAFCRRTGYRREEVIGRSARELNLFAEEGDLQAFTERIARDGRIDLMEQKFRTKDGRFTVTLMSARRIRYEGQACVLVITVDIGEIKKAEQMLRESEALHRMILDSAPCAIAITRLSDSCFLLVNEAFCHETGYSRTETIGRSNADLHLYADPGARKRLVALFRRDQRVEGMEIRFRSKEGRLYESLVSVNPIRYQGEDCLLTTSVEITQRKQTERELDRYRRQLEEMVHSRTLELRAAQEELIKREKLAVLGQLTATVSHELRNPLGVIRSSNFYLQKKVKPQDERIDKHFRRIEEQVAMCDAIVADLLEFTRGRIISLEKEDLVPWLEAMVAQLQEENGVTIELHLHQRPIPVPHDRQKLSRAFLNVLDNAVQAVNARLHTTAEAGESRYVPRIVVTTACRDDQAVITVADNGIGMSQDTLERAFEPLFTTRARGTGLGLANVKKIVEEHGGRIELASRLAEGTCMTILLPCK